MIRQRLSALLVLITLALPVSAAAANAAPIDAFYGQWKGSGLAKSPDALLMGVTARDFDVVIEPAGDGFRVTWTTVIRDNESDKVRRKTTTFDFLPSDRKEVFRSAASADPLTGEAYAWAHIREQTLTVTLFTIAEDGSYHLQSYERTLTGFGMDFQFTRIQDNRTRFVVGGKLVRVAN